MRIIGGTRRSLPLKTPKGTNTRPTTDRIKETLFNMLQQSLPQARFLDLFAGSGGIGLEALSRGASYAVFIENNKEALSCIQANIAFTKFTNQAKVMNCDVLRGLYSLEGEEPFDLIFMDPPYGNLFEKEVLTFLSKSKLITSETLIVVEADLATDFSYLSELGFELKKYKKYKSNAHAFIYRTGE